MHFFPTLVYSVLCNSENEGHINSDSSNLLTIFINSSSVSFSQELLIKLETGISIIRASLFFCLNTGVRWSFFSRFLRYEI